MSGTLSHRQIEELLGAFALDAVDDDERDVVESHLVACPRCRAEVSGHRETAALLAHSGTPAPAGVWNRITEALDEPPPALDLARLAPGGPGGRPLRGRRSISLRLAAATVAVAAAFAAFVAVRVSNQDRRLDRITAALAEKDTLRRAALAAVGHPRASDVRLVSADGKLAARVIRLPDGTGYVVANHLRPLPSDRTYQLWALRQDARISVGVLGPDPEVAAFPIDGPVAGFAITDEPAGGVVATSNAPVVVGWLPPV